MSIILLLGICLLTRLVGVKANRKAERSRHSPEGTSSNTGSSSGASDNWLQSSGSGKSDCDNRDLFIWLLLLTIGTILVIVAVACLCIAWRRLRRNVCTLKQKITYMEMETILRLPEFAHCGDEDSRVAMGSSGGRGSFELVFSQDKTLNARYLGSGSAGVGECRLGLVPAWLVVCTVSLSLLVLSVALLALFAMRLVMAQDSLKQRVKHIDMENLMALPKTHDEEEYAH